jgi:hypothetical protein
MASARWGDHQAALEIVVPARNEARKLPEVPVCWRDVAGSTFSVARHSAAVFGDIAALWLRTRAEPAAGREPAHREPAHREPALCEGPRPAVAGPA